MKLNFYFIIIRSLRWFEIPEFCGYCSSIVPLEFIKFTKFWQNLYSFLKYSKSNIITLWNKILTTKIPEIFCGELIISRNFPQFYKLWIHTKSLLKNYYEMKLGIMKSYFILLSHLNFIFEVLNYYKFRQTSYSTFKSYNFIKLWISGN